MNSAKLENLLGHRFTSPELLERALTHTSWRHENEDRGAQGDNERLEFVGDSVLGLAIAEQLYSRNPSMSEGELTLMKHRLVSTVTLAEIAEELSLGEFIRIGKGEERTGGRKKQALLAGTVEAVIAAVFLDSGYIAARAMISRLFAKRLRTATPHGSLDFKSMLQETLQAGGLKAPEYSVLRTEGQPHERMFHVEAVWNGGRSEGSGRSIKSAEMQAAERALASLSLPPRAAKRKEV